MKNFSTEDNNIILGGDEMKASSAASRDRDLIGVMPQVVAP
ncbi:hypothetical protein [Mesorhizobium sp.]|nr:hypothetical protein [Mesorhizobium sp.]